MHPVVRTRKGFSSAGPSFLNRRDAAALSFRASCKPPAFRHGAVDLSIALAASVPARSLGVESNAEPLDLLDVAVQVIVVRSLAALLAQTQAERFVAEQGGHRRFALGLRSHEDSAFALANQRRQSAFGSRDDRLGGGHRLERGHAKFLVVRQEHQETAVRVGIEQVGTSERAQEAYPWPSKRAQIGDVARIAIAVDPEIEPQLGW